MEERTVVIVDDHPIFRSGLSQIIAAEPAYRVVAEGASGAEAIGLARDHSPHLMLLDVSMRPGGIEAVPDILAVSPASQIIMLSADGQPALVARALASGAAGYMLKDTPHRDLLHAMAETANGRAYISPALMAGLLAYQSTESRGDRTRFESLTLSERRVLDLLTEGLNNAEIASALAIQVKTVKFHLSHIYHKLGVRNRVEAALLGRRDAP